MLFCFFSISDSEELLLYIIVKHFVICIFETRRVNTFYLLVCKKPKKKSRLLFWRTNRKWFLSTPDCSLAVIGLDGRCLGNDINPGPRFLHFKGFRSSARSASSPSNHPSSLRPEPPTRSFRNEMRSRVRRRNGEKRLNNRERRSGEGDGRARSQVRGGV